MNMKPNADSVTVGGREWLENIHKSEIKNGDKQIYQKKKKKIKKKENWVAKDQYLTKVLEIDCWKVDPGSRMKHNH